MKNKRKNGLARPFGLMQICSWVFVAFQVVSVGLTTVPLLRKELIVGFM